MKKIILLLTCFLLASTSSFATTLKRSVDSCDGDGQYFKFTNQYQKDEAALFVTVKNKYVETTLSSMTFFIGGESSEVFKNLFLSTEGLLAGQTMFMTKDKVAESLCGVYFACECGPSGQCSDEITVSGPRCHLSGNGTSDDPYVMSLI